MNNWMYSAGWTLVHSCGKVPRLPLPPRWSSALPAKNGLAALRHRVRRHGRDARLRGVTARSSTRQRKMFQRRENRRLSIGPRAGRYSAADPYHSYATRRRCRMHVASRRCCRDRLGMVVWCALITRARDCRVVACSPSSHDRVGVAGVELAGHGQSHCVAAWARARHSDCRVAADRRTAGRRLPSSCGRAADSRNIAAHGCAGRGDHRARTGTCAAPRHMINLMQTLAETLLHPPGRVVAWRAFATSAAFRDDAAARYGDRLLRAALAG